MKTMRFSVFLAEDYLMVFWGSIQKSQAFHGNMWKTVHEQCKKYPGDLLLLLWFCNVYLMNSLLSHKDTGEDLWMEMKWHTDW